MASFMRTIISGTKGGALTMTEPMDDDIWNNALEWHSAQQQDDCDWDGFTAWLEADARHRAAFDEVALLEDSLARACPALQSILPSDSDEAAGKKSVWHNPWAGLGAGAAAAAIALLAVPMLATGGGGAILGRGWVRARRQLRSRSWLFRCWRPAEGRSPIRLGPAKRAASIWRTDHMSSLRRRAASLWARAASVK